MRNLALVLGALLLGMLPVQPVAAATSATEATASTTEPITLADGRKFVLSVRRGFGIKVAAEGLKRVRFMAQSPDGRLFVTDMYDQSDNRKGRVYILERFSEKSGKFGRIATYLSNLRNPNSLAFYTDKSGITWLYLALTDRLVRYRYTPGEDQPRTEPEVLATFPDYGLSYKYGGWHLTRTVSIGPDEKVYVSVGSSCNACIEKEPVRASVLVLDPDGRNQHTYASGLRNAVGLTWVGEALYATDMGADHLGDDRPEDLLYRLEAGKHYGWPYCYETGAKVYPDPGLNRAAQTFDCRRVPAALSDLGAHSAPLGLAYFGGSAAPELKNSFLVALHGSGKRSLGRGYSIVQVQGRRRREFIGGFIRNGKVVGRPVALLQTGADQFLFTDDFAGVVYYVFKRPTLSK